LGKAIFETVGLGHLTTRWGKVGRLVGSRFPSIFPHVDKCPFSPMPTQPQVGFWQRKVVTTMADGAANIVTGSTSGATTVAAERLRSFLERVERLDEEKATIAGDIKEVFAEAKGEGYDTKTLRKIIRLRKMDKAKRDEEDALLELYLAALGEI